MVEAAIVHRKAVPATTPCRARDMRAVDSCILRASRAMLIAVLLGWTRRVTMINTAFAVVITGFCLIAPALADDAMPENDGGRYTFSKVAEGFVRLDTQTGEVSMCGQRTVGWACQAVPEDRAVLESEIARLRRENAALKKDILAHGLPLPAGTVPEPPIVRGDHAPPPRLHSDLDRMMALVDRVWQRLVEALAHAQRQMLNKS